ncbi:hypothetical protein QYM36_007789, partial [Artemia franciscana]
MEAGAKQESLREQALFWTTASFVLLATFSLFAFLFLVPFFIEPAMTTLALEFDPIGTTCYTVASVRKRGQSNCTWSSCREGCTKEVFDCWQIKVQYVGPRIPELDDVEDEYIDEDLIVTVTTTETPEVKRDKAIIIPSLENLHNEVVAKNKELEKIQVDEEIDETEFALSRVKEYLGEIGQDFVLRTARLYPNVKGCGYPPELQCESFVDSHAPLRTNFTCYYSLVEPYKVITELNLEKVYNNLVYCLTIPIVSFVISVLYLVYAYFFIYNEDQNPQVVITAAEGEESEEDISMMTVEGKEILMSLNRDGIIDLKPVTEDVSDLVLVNNARNQVHLSNSLKSSSGDSKLVTPGVTPNGEILKASDVPCKESPTSHGTVSPLSSIFSEEEETQSVR